MYDGWSEPLRVDKKLSNADSWREVIKKTRRRYDTDSRIQYKPTEAGKPLLNTREYGTIESSCRWKADCENPEKASRGNGNKYKDQAEIQNWRTSGPGHRIDF